MSRFRFSLLSLAGATAAIAVVCGALVRATGWIADVTWAATLFGLTSTLLCAMLVSPGRRGLWTGFSLFGWTYVLLAYSPLADRPNVPSLVPLLKRGAEAMPQAKVLKSVTIHTDGLTDLSASLQLLSANAVPGQSAQAVDAGLEYLALSQVFGNTEFIDSFVRISQAFIALLLGFIGGIAGHLIRQRSLSALPAET